MMIDGFFLLRVFLEVCKMRMSLAWSLANGVLGDYLIYSIHMI